GRLNAVQHSSGSADWHPLHSTRMKLLGALFQREAAELSRWYGSPGSWLRSRPSNDMVLIGASVENLVMLASLISGGRSVAFTSGTSAHRFVPHPANTEVSHADFYRAIGLQLPSTAMVADAWNDRGDKLYL